MEIITQNIDKNNIEKYISKSLLNHLYEGIYFVDKNKTIKLWNKGAENITGFTANEVEGKNCSNNILCHENHLGKLICGLECPLTTSIKNNSFIDKRIYLRHKKGHKIPVWVHVTPIKNQTGEIIGAVEVFVDNSDYEKLKIINNRLEELNELKNQFLGMAAHDLRNPLNLISNYSEFLLSVNNNNLDNKQISMLEKINENCASMLKMIDHLLDITAIESGKINLNIEKINIKNLLNTDNYSLKFMAEHKNIKINSEIQDNLPEIEADSSRISQAIENLISNAIKFSFPESEITIKASKNNNYIIISVIDQGQGIPEIDMPNLFKPFEKTSTKPTGQEKSTGLGLVIVKKIIELHKGIIEVKSKLNKGSEFIIKLPY